MGERTTNINFKFTSLFSKNNNNYKVYFFRRFISLKQIRNLTPFKKLKFDIDIDVLKIILIHKDLKNIECYQI